MKIVVNIARVIVGFLFIFSGLVKANDPMGLSYKMQEFFEVWGQYGGLHGFMLWLDNFALVFSITMITLEIIAGVALLLGWQRRFFSGLLLILMIFFLFLTGYAVLSGKIRTCGCFGDCIPLTAMQSFIKDIVLFLLVLIICFGVKYIQPMFKRGASFFLVILSTVLALAMQFYVLRHQPFSDCLPFKKGNDLLALRKMPADAVPDKVDFKFIYEKNGKQQTFDKTQLPDSSWTFIKRDDILLEKGKNNEPPIKDFFLNTLGGTDSTDAILNQPGDYYLFFIRDFAGGTNNWLNNFSALYTYAKNNNRPIYIVASQATAAQEFFNVRNNYNLQVLSCDITALKTAARTNPSLYLMHGPVVKNKLGWADFSKAMKQ